MELMALLERSGCKPLRFRSLRLVPLCLIWCVWREHNICSFEDCERMVPYLKAFCSNPFMFGWLCSIVLTFLTS
jgi:hypothetical protein